MILIGELMVKDILVMPSLQLVDSTLADFT